MIKYYMAQKTTQSKCSSIHPKSVQNLDSDQSILFSRKAAKHDHWEKGDRIYEKMY